MGSQLAGRLHEPGLEQISGGQLAKCDYDRKKRALNLERFEDVASPNLVL